MKKLAKEGWWVIFSQLIQLVVGVFYIKIVSEYLTLEEFGRYSLDVTFTVLVDVMVMGGVRAGVVRFYFVAQEEGEKNYLFRSIVKLLILISVGVFLLCAVAYAIIFAIYGSKNSAEIIAIGLIIIASAAHGLVNSIHSGARRQKVVAFSNCGLYICRALFVYFLSPMLFMVMEKYVAILACVFLSTIVMCYYSIREFNKSENFSYKNGNKKSEDWLRKIISFSMPYSSWGVFSWAQQIGDRWILNYNLGISSVGLYVAMYQTIYAPMLAAGMSLLGFINPIMYQKIGDSTNKSKIISVHQKLKIMCVIGIIFSIAISFLAFIFKGYISQFMMAEKYSGYEIFLPAYVVSAGIMACYHLIGAIIPAIFKNKEIIFAVIFLGVGSLAMQFLCSLYYGFEGIIFALIASSFLYMIVMWVVVNYMVKLRISEIDGAVKVV